MRVWVLDQVKSLRLAEMIAEGKGNPKWRVEVKITSCNPETVAAAGDKVLTFLF